VISFSGPQDEVNNNCRLFESFIQAEFAAYRRGGLALTKRRCGAAIAILSGLAVHLSVIANLGGSR
jgi:hypothetical protein